MSREIRNKRLSAIVSGISDDMRSTDGVPAPAAPSNDERVPRTAIGRFTYERDTVAKLEEEIERLKQAGSRVRIPLNRIDARGHRKLDEDHVEAIRAAWEAGSVPEPIVVRKRGDDDYPLISGQHRAEAARRMGHTDIEGYIIELDDAAAALRIVTSNNVKGLADWEKAKAAAKLISETGKSQEEVARLLGLAQSSVSQLLSMLRLPEELKLQLDRNPDKLGRAVVLDAILPALQARPDLEGSIVETVIDLIFVRGVPQTALKSALAQKLATRQKPPVERFRIGEGDRGFVVKCQGQDIALKLGESVDPTLVREEIKALLKRLSRKA